MSDERGYTLMEMLVAMALFTIVLIAILDTLDVMTTQSKVADRRNDAQQQSRASIDLMARELRNLASPTPRRPQAVDKATANDLVFQTVDPVGPNSGANAPNVRRMRYCVGGTRLYRQVQTWTTSTTPAAPATGSCPSSDPGWSLTGVAARNVVNGNRPVWQYDSATLTDITFIRATLIVDADPTRAPNEIAVSTGIFLRNQNRSPAASFTATPTGGRHVLLNGSLSTDPEGEALTYAWFDGTTAIGSGITFDYVAPATGTRTLDLTVTDPGGLQDDAPAQQVIVR